MPVSFSKKFLRFLPAILRLRTSPSAAEPEIAVPADLPCVAAAAPVVAQQAGLGAVSEVNASALLVHWLGQGRYVESLSFLAHGLSNRDGVRWAVEACELAPGMREPADTNAAAACRAWIAQPGIATAELAAQAARATQPYSATGWAAQAAAWAGASPADASVAGVTPRLPSKAVLGSVMLAAASSGRDLGAMVKQAGLEGLRPAVPAEAPASMVAAASVNPALRGIYRPYLERGLAIAAGA